MSQVPISRRVIGFALEVHKVLGPGLLESAYEECLSYELLQNGLSFERQVGIPIQYKQISIVGGYKADLLVEGTLIVELKSVEHLLPIHEAQLLTYLRFARKPVGLLINFNSLKLRDGIKRFIKSEHLSGRMPDEI